jgi:hypothetical protein
MTVEEAALFEVGAAFEMSADVSFPNFAKEQHSGSILTPEGASIVADETATLAS